MTRWINRISRYRNELIETEQWMNMNYDVPLPVKNVIMRGMVRTEKELKICRKHMEHETY